MLDIFVLSYRGFSRGVLLNVGVFPGGKNCTFSTVEEHIAIAMAVGHETCQILGSRMGSGCWPSFIILGSVQYVFFDSVDELVWSQSRSRYSITCIGVI